MNNALTFDPFEPERILDMYVHLSSHLVTVVFVFVCSALPVNTYGGIGRSAQGIMSPISSGYTSACKLLIYIHRDSGLLYALTDVILTKKICTLFGNLRCIMCSCFL